MKDTKEFSENVKGREMPKEEMIKETHILLDRIEANIQFIVEDIKKKKA